MTEIIAIDRIAGLSVMIGVIVVGSVVLIVGVDIIGLTDAAKIFINLVLKKLNIYFLLKVSAHLI